MVCCCIQIIILSGNSLRLKAFATRVWGWKLNLWNGTPLLHISRWWCHEHMGGGFHFSGFSRVVLVDMFVLHWYQMSRGMQNTGLQAELHIQNMETLLSLSQRPRFESWNFISSVRFVSSTSAFCSSDGFEPLGLVSCLHTRMQHHDRSFPRRNGTPPTCNTEGWGWGLF